MPDDERKSVCAGLIPYRVRYSSKSILRKSNKDVNDKGILLAVDHSHLVYWICAMHFLLNSKGMYKRHRAQAPY